MWREDGEVNFFVDTMAIPLVGRRHTHIHTMRNVELSEMARQGMVLAACGATVLAARRMIPMGDRHDACSFINAARTPHLARHGGLTSIVGRFAVLGDDEALLALAGQVEDALARAADLSIRRYAPHRERLRWGEELNRATGRARLVAQTAIRRAKRVAESEDSVLACVACVDEHLPALEGALDGVLHNALLDAGAK